MKKSFFLFAALLTSFGICAAERGVVNADILNLRQGPSFKSPVVGRCVRNDEVAILRVMGNWAELELPAKLPVYVSESRLQHGKTISGVNLRSKPSASAPSLGMLPAGTEVKVLKQEKFGWVRIAPPDGFKVYTAKMYLSFDEKKLESVNPPPVTAPAEEKPAPAAPAKELEPPVIPEAVAPAVKAAAPVKTAAPAAKAVEPVKAAPAAKAAEPAVKAEPVVKAEPAAKAAEPVKAAPAIPAKATAPAPGAGLDPDLRAAFTRLGVDWEKAPAEISCKGKLTKLKFSQNPATDYALMNEKNGKNLAFVCAKESSVLNASEGKNVVVTGDAYPLPGGAAPVICVTALKEE